VELRNKALLLRDTEGVDEGEFAVEVFERLEEEFLEGVNEERDCLFEIKEVDEFQAVFLREFVG